MDAIFKRASVRSYTDEPVKDEDVERLLRAGMAAPSAANQQPWEFYVVRDRGLLERLAEATPFAGQTRDAALAIVPCMRAEGLRVPAMVDQDMGACVENILLEAASLGLGAVWQGVHPEPSWVVQVSGILDTAPGLTPFCTIAVGHPAEEPNAAGPGRYDESRVHRR